MEVSEGIARLISGEFPEYNPEKVAAKVARSQTARLQRAVLKLADGDFDKLIEYVEQSQSQPDFNIEQAELLDSGQ